jgi:hypothetical protein
MDGEPRMSLSSDSLSDLDAMLADAGDVVVCGTVTDFGIYETGTSFTFNEVNADIQEKVMTLLVRTGRFPLKKMGLLTIAGVQHQVREWSSEDDGQVTRVVVARTST